jgi:hypothetical protein
VTRCQRFMSRIAFSDGSFRVVMVDSATTAAEVTYQLQPFALFFSLLCTFLSHIRVLTHNWRLQCVQLVLMRLGLDSGPTTATKTNEAFTAFGLPVFALYESSNALQRRILPSEKVRERERERKREKERD